MSEHRSVASGRVVRIGVKGAVPGEHGLPKPEVDTARFSRLGVEGDYNLYRQTQRAGDPEMAILLMPLETIEELNREGWPVRPGDLGENVTTGGVPYDRLAPPARMRVGEAVLRVAKPCTPCDNLFLLPYVGPDRGPAFLRATLDRRGWFAEVLQEGRVRRGDRIELLAAMP